QSAEALRNSLEPERVPGREKFPWHRVGDRCHGAFVEPAYGQLGSSRVPTLKSSFFIPSIWSMPSTLRSTLLYRLPCGSLTTSVMNVEPHDWQGVYRHYHT